MDQNEQQPLGMPPYTMFHNYTLDAIMRDLSPNAWKVLCWAIRKTWGWVDTTTASGRKESDQISYSQFMEGTGIRSRTTISRAIQECLEAGYLLRKKVGEDPRSRKPLYAYALNTDYRPVSSPEIGPLVSGPENGLLSSPESGLLSSPESGLTKERKKTNKDVDAVVSTDEQQTAYDLLLTIPDMDPSIAQYVVQVCNLDTVPGWVAAGKRARVDSQAALVVRRLLDHVPAPSTAEKVINDDERHLIQEEQDLVERPPSYREQIMVRYSITPETLALWEKAKDELRLQMTKATFDTWLAGAWLLRIDDSNTNGEAKQAVIGATNSYAVDWLSNRLDKLIQKTLTRHLGEPVELVFEVLDQESDG